MIGYVFFGLMFGFALSRAGATRFDAIHRMFLLEDAHLIGVMAMAIVVSGAGYLLFRRGVLRPRNGEAPNLKPKPMQPGLILGGLLFGAGWAITGACPGTVLVQIGEGALGGVLTFAGILLGARLQSAWINGSRCRGACAPGSTPRSPSNSGSL